MHELIEHHRRACDGFSRAVRSAAGRWDAPSPCAGWDARAVLEHVIGFHDVLLLEPLGAKPKRPRGAPEGRWSVTVEALMGALEAPGVMDAGRESLLAVLTTDVVVHTWDLAKATGHDVILDVDLSELGLRRAEENQEQLAASGWFAPPVAVADDAAVQDRLLGLFGRDPSWRPPG